MTALIDNPSPATAALATNPTLKRCTGKPNRPVESQRSLRAGNGCSTCGQSEGLYWAHVDGEVEGMPHRHCDACNKTVSLVFVEANKGTTGLIKVHPHQPRTKGSGGPTSYGSKPSTETATKPTVPSPWDIMAGQQAATIDPKTEGCEAYAPSGKYACTSHRGGMHLAEGMGGSVYETWPLDEGLEGDDVSTGYEVELVNAGLSKIQVIKAIRTYTGLGLKESKDACEMPEKTGKPYTLPEMASIGQAERFRDDLIAAGATARVKSKEAPVQDTGLSKSDAPLPQLDNGGNAQAVQALLAMLQQPQITPEQIKAMVDAAVDANNKTLLTMVGEVMSDKLDEVAKGVLHTVEYKQPEGKPSITVEGAHRDLRKCVSALKRGKNVFMSGMAGTGKTTLAAHCAEALGIPLYDISLSPDAGRHLLMGFQTADGTFMPPALYHAYRDGGLFHFDECDNSNPGLITVVNQILANGFVRFADGTLVTKHPDFRAMASGNTYGNGPDATYMGRQPLDGAFKNRWVFVTVLVDESVEQKMCEATGAPKHIVTEALRYVRALRKSATDQGLPLLFTPRNSENICDLYMANMDDPGTWDTAGIVDSAVRQGMSPTDWRRVHKQDKPGETVSPLAFK